MKQEKIKDLFDKNADIMNGVRVLFDTDFVQAINQAELEWYKELDKKLENILISSPNDWDVACKVSEYYNEIQNKIKELSK